MRLVKTTFVSTGTHRLAPNSELCKCYMVSVSYPLLRIPLYEKLWMQFKLSCTSQVPDLWSSG